MDREKLNEYLRSIATQAVQAQSEQNFEKLLDLLSDIRDDVAKAEAEAYEA